MANSFAYIAISLWPLAVFTLLIRVGVVKGIFVATMLSYLLLPVGFEINFPGIPAFNKASVTSISVLLFLIFKRKGIGISELSLKVKFLLIIMVISPFLTVMANNDQYLHIPGISLYDGLSQTVGALLVFIPFLFGYKFFRTKESHVLVLRYFVIMVLFYSVLIIYEIRMSPQLHTMLYGYFPHSFVQQFREGGFRAVVFLGHGLLVALLLSVAFLISTILWRSKIKVSSLFNNNVAVVVFLLILLILSKSYGALLIGIVGFVFLRFFSQKTIFLISYILLSTYLVYPVLSATNVFPHDQVVSVVNSFNPARAQSLQFRFYHENQLLLHANEKPLLGWGGWGRNRIFDPETFADLSVTDGRWIITLGTKGWVGFLVEFLFIAISVLYASKAASILNRNKETRGDAFMITGHALIVSLILIDQIPNSSLNYFYWLFIGILYGRSYAVVHEKANIST